MSDLSGQSLRGYALRERIGAGAFGEVYRARQQAIFDREVALKVIAPQYANQPNFIRDFESEAQLVSQLEHPHIVPLLDFWREPDSAYLVMRLLRGGSLKERIEDHALSTDEALKLLEQVGGALTHAHHQRVVHRDLKPANILLDENGNAYLADFGLALIISGDEQKHDGVEGTLMYMSPEQLMGAAISPCSDLFSLGLLLYEALTGRHPFASSSSQVEMLTKLMNEPLPPLGAQRPDLPPSLDEVIQTATAKQPAERYSEASELVTAFRAALGLAAPVVIAEADIYNPYKGLRAFSEADAGDFFGREALVQQLLGRMAEDDPASRFLALVGPSGSGKSSAVQAGLIPALRSGRLPGSEDWYIARMRPDRQPFEALAQALLGVAARDYPDLSNFLAQGPENLLTTTQEILPDDAELLLVIDQFEELFTLTDDEATRSAFLESLQHAVTTSQSPMRIVVALRADFYDRPLEYPGFAELMRARQETILLLSASELEAAVVGPARKLSINFEEGLAAAIIDDIGHEPGALPLLQYALTRLFDEREGRMLTYAAYRAMYGVSGALAQRAEEVFTSLDPPEQAAARQIFLRLVEPGEGQEDTRQRAALSTLAELGVPGHVQEALDAFDRNRLLTFDRDPESREPVVELAHEALLRQWGRLRGWIDESRSEIHLRQGLSDAAEAWTVASQDDSYLLPGGARLEALAEWAHATDMVLSANESEFLEASLLAEQEQQAHEARLERRARRVLQILVGVFLLAAVISGWQAIRARNSELGAQRQAAILLAAQAEAELEDGYGDRAILLGLEALEHYPYTSQAERALGTAVSYNRALQQYAGHEIAVTGIDWSPDGTKIASISTDNTIHIWDPETGEAIRIIELPEGITGNYFDWGLAVKWSPDGKYLLTLSGDRYLLGSQDYDLIIWDASTGEQIKLLEIQNDAIPEEGEISTSYTHYPTGEAINFAPRTGRVATVGGDNTAIVWKSLLEEQQLVLAGHEKSVNSVVWSPDEMFLATASVDGTVRIWDAVTGEGALVIVGHEDEVNLALWSPDGERIVTASKDSTVRSWDIKTGELVEIIELNAGDVWSLDWSSDGRTLVIGTDDSGLYMWDIESQTQISQLNGHLNFVPHLAWSPVDDRLASAGSGGIIRIWNAAQSTAKYSFPYNVDIPTWSSDGSSLVVPVYGDNGELIIWDMAQGQAAARNLDNGLNYSWGHAVYSPDEELLLTRGSPPGWPPVLPESARSLVLDAWSGEIIRSFEIPSDNEMGWIRAIAWSPDGQQVALGSADTKIYLFNYETGELTHTLLGSQFGMIGHLAYSPDGSSLLSTGDDKTARIWNTTTGEMERVFADHETWPWYAGWSPDGSKILTTDGDDQKGGGENAVRIWDVQTGEELLFIGSHTGQVKGADWSPDGTRIVSGSSDDTTRVWDAQTGDELLTFDSPNNWGATPQWSPDGKYLVIAIATFDRTPNTEVFRVWQSADELIKYAYECCVFRDLTPEERQQFGLPSVEEQAIDMNAYHNRLSRFPASIAAFGLASLGLGVMVKHRTTGSPLS